MGASVFAPAVALFAACAMDDFNCENVCLFDLLFYVPSTIFQLNKDGSSWVETVLS